MTKLEYRWARICYDLGVEKSSREIYRFIESAYSEEYRYYHNLTHLKNCFEELEDYPLNGITSLERSVISMALFFHDIIITPGISGDEARSSEFFSRIYSAFKESPAHMSIISNLILSTSFPHYDNSSNLSKVIMDVDIASLGYSSKEFNENWALIKMEYPMISEEEFNTNRAALLSGLLSSEPIFKTNHFREKYEEQARKNITEKVNSILGTKNNSTLVTNYEQLVPEVEGMPEEYITITNPWDISNSNLISRLSTYYNAADYTIHIENSNA